MINRIVLSLFVLVVLPFASFSQMQYLSTLSVRDIFHDKNNLYQATAGGLVVTNDDMGNEKRYDHSNGLPTNELSQVEVDSAGIVWVASGCRVMGLRLSATTATVVVDTAFPTFQCGLVALKGTLWVLAGGKMHSYQQGRWTVYAGNSVVGTPIRADDEGNLWTVCNNNYAGQNGIWCFNTKSKAWSEVGFPIFFKDAWLSSFAVVGPNSFLFSFWSGQANPANGLYLANREYQGDDTVWVWEGIDTVACGLFNDSYGTTFVYKNEELNACELISNHELDFVPTGITQVSLSCIETYGPERKLWMGDPTYGLSYFKNMAMVGKNTSVAGTAQFPFGINSIKSVTIDADGNAWMMEQMERFISIFNPKSGTWKTQNNHLDGVTSATVRAIGRGSNGDMWFATDKELVKKKSDGSRLTYLGRGGNYVYDKMKDFVWVVGDSNKIQAYSYKTNNLQPVIRCEVYPNLVLTKIVPISPTEFYVASSGSNQAIYHYKNGVWKMTIVATTGTCDMDVKDGEVFIGTDYGVHSSVDGQAWEFTPNNSRGLNYSELYSLEVAPTGNIFISTDKGLFAGADDGTWSRVPHGPIVTPIVNQIVFDTINNLVWYPGTEGVTTFPWFGRATLVSSPKLSKLSAPSISLNRQGISYSLPGKDDIRLSVFSVSGRQLVNKVISGSVRTGFVSLPNAAAGNLVYKISSGKTQVTGSLTSVK